MCKDEEMIRNPQRWPCFPVLPLRHRHNDTFGDDGLGLMCGAQDKPPYVVHVGCMFLPSKEVKTYPTLDALLKDWQVD